MTQRPASTRLGEVAQGEEGLMERETDHILVKIESSLVFSEYFTFMLRG